MTKSQRYILLACVIVCSSFLLMLYFASPLSQNLYRGGFNRKFIPNSNLKEVATLNLDKGSYYVAGQTANHVYLGKVLEPFKLIILDVKEAAIETAKLQIDNEKQLEKEPGFSIKIDSPYYFISNGVLPAIYRGKLNMWKAERFMPDSAFFVEAIPLSGNSFALRSNSTLSQQFELAKECKIDSPFFQFKYGLLKKQVDGYFCVEGSLHRSEDMQSLIYLYAYRNQFLVLDTNLNLMHEYHTIDTFSHAKVRVANIASKGYSTLAVPPTQININGIAFENKFIVQSNLMAKNEDQQEFESSSTFDIYELATGLYLQSFHIPDYNRMKVQDFTISDGRLIAVFGKNLVLYDLDKSVSGAFIGENNSGKMTLRQ